MICFPLFGMEVRLGFSFVAVLCLISALGGGELGLFCAGAGLFHEMGHLFAMACFGALPKVMTFSFEGISLTPSTRLLSPGKEGGILLCGSLFNLLLAIFPLPTEYRLSSVVLGCFNLLPLAGLDGGKLLSLLLSPLCPPVGEKICRGVSFVTGVVLSVLAVRLFLQEGNFSLLLTVGYFLCLV